MQAMHSQINEGDRMSQELTTAKPNYLVPQTFEQAERYADKIATSSLCPAAFKNKGGDVLIAMQMGAEVGLSPMQALQNIAVINGRPSVYGDAAMGIVRSHPHCQGIREWAEGTVQESNIIAYCGVTRRGQSEEVRSFSIEQAKKAGLWGKAGPWSQYPERMLQMRARGFAIRDTFPDALRGLSIAEEAQDIIDITSVSTISHATTPHIPKHIEGVSLSQQMTVDPELLQKHLDIINKCTDVETLKIAYNDGILATKNDKDGRNQITSATKLQKENIANVKVQTEENERIQTNKQFLDDYDAAGAK